MDRDARKDHAWRNRSTVRADEILDQPLIVLLKHNPFRTMLNRLLWREGGLPHIVVETSDVLSAIEHVEQGIGLAVVNPFPVMLQHGADIHFARLEPSLTYETCILTNSVGPPAPGVGLFIEALRATQPAEMDLSSAVA